MSELLVPVTTISNIRAHPNAESLDIAEVLGWQVVVKKGSYIQGEKVVFFPPDTVLSTEVSDRFGVTQYLSRQRIKSTRLRGEPSFGLVMPVEDPSWEVEQDVAAHYGAMKWEPPHRESRGGFHQPNEYAVPQHPLFSKYTDIQNMRHYPSLFEGEQVVVTEKIHGTNSRIGLVDGEWAAGSHKVQRGPTDLLYWSPKEIVGPLVEYLGRYHKQVIVYGEIYGESVQSLSYGAKGYEGYRVFDVLLDGKFLDWPTFDHLCFELDIPTVPPLFQGVFSLDRVRELSVGQTELGASHMREGVVVKPVVERQDPRVGRAILKYVGDDYLLAKKTDFVDE